MRGFHPACSVPRRRRLRRRLTQNGRTLVLAVRTFHALRRTPSPPWRSPRGLSRCAHFQSTTVPAFSHYEAPGGLHMCSLPTQDEPCHRRQGNTSEGRPCLGCGKPSAGPPVRGPWWQPLRGARLWRRATLPPKRSSLPRAAARAPRSHPYPGVLAEAPAGTPTGPPHRGSPE